MFVYPHLLNLHLFYISTVYIKLFFNLILTIQRAINFAKTEEMEFQFQNENIKHILEI